MYELTIYNKTLGYIHTCYLADKPITDDNIDIAIYELTKKSGFKIVSIKKDGEFLSYEEKENLLGMSLPEDFFERYHKFWEQVI